MSWLRIDDGEVLDDRIGDLTDREYRARHALLQYVAREANETGIVHESRVNRAAFSTVRGVRAVTPTILRRFIQLGLVERLENLENAYLESLNITRPEGPGWLRPSHWERFNPPKDSTNAERQKRYRESLRNAVTNDVTPRDENGPTRAGAARVPVPSPKELRTNPPTHPPELDKTGGRAGGRNHSEDEQARIDHIDEILEHGAPPPPPELDPELVDGGHGYLIPKQTSDLPVELEAIDAPAILAALERNQR